MVISHGEGDLVELLERLVGSEEGVCVGQGLEFLVWGVHRLVTVSAPLSAFGVDCDLREEAGSVEVEVRAQDVAREGADGIGMVARDVAIAEVLTYDRGVLALDQSIVVAASGTALGELDMELLQKLGDLVVDVLGAVVRVEASDKEGEGLECVFKHWDEEYLADAFDRIDHFVLRDGIDQVDDVYALSLIHISEPTRPY